MDSVNGLKGKCRSELVGMSLSVLLLIFLHFLSQFPNDFVELE